MSSFQLSHIFGLKGKVKGNLIYIEENVVVYPCGHVIVVLNTETKLQKFLSATDGSEGITAMSCSPSRRILAVAEKNVNERAIINLFDVSLMKKRKSLSSLEIQSSEFVNVVFSPDNRLLLTQSGAPDWTLSVWAWEKGKHLVSMKISNLQGSEIYQADFNPWDSSIICVSGDGILKFLKLQDGALKQVPMSFKREAQKYLCHAWLPDDRTVVATDTGELLLFESFELRGVIPFSTESLTIGGENTVMQSGDMVAIHSIITYNKGFVCGGAKNMLRVFEKSDDPQEFYKHTKTFTVEGKASKILTLALSPSEDNLACVLSNHQMYVLGLSNTDILKAEEMSFELLSNSVHGPGTFQGNTMSSNSGSDAVGDHKGNAQITGLDVCIRKPFIATCGMDRSVRIWNYIEKTTELIKEFMDEPNSIAFHPSGLHILVGFADKLRLMNLLMDDIRTYKEFPIKGCRECRFSNGGMYFAAANGNTIQLFKTYSFECFLTLRGHSGRVRSIQFSKDDQSIISAGYDGSLYRWSLKTGQVEAEKQQSSGVQLINAIPGNGESSTIYATSSDKLVKEIELFSGNTKFELDAPAGSFGQIIMSSSYRSFFVALDRPGLPGSLLSLKLPLNTNQGYFENVEKFSAHSRSITRMCMSPDDQYLFTAGDDGSLAIFEVRDPGAASSKKRDKDPPLQFAEEILVTRSDLEEKASLMQELKNKVDELTLHNEYQLRLKDMNYNEKIKEVTDKFTEELELDRSKYQTLKEEKNEMVKMYKEKFIDLKENEARELTEVSKSYQAKINAEISRYEELVQEREHLCQEWEEQNQMLVESHETFVNELTEEYENQLESEEKERGDVGKEKTRIMHEYEKTKDLIEDDADYEIDELKKKYDAKLTVERESTLRLKGENGIMKKKFSALQNDIEEKKDRIKSLIDREVELYEKIKGLEKDIHGHKKEIKEREETIQDKEKRIYDLKKKNQELEKFKFVLDYKIKELKRQIEPRENEIADMRQQIKEMDLELEQYHKSNGALDLMIGELRLKIEGMQKELDDQNRNLTLGEGFSVQYRNDLHEAMQNVDQYKEVKSGVISMYKNYIQNGNVAKAIPSSKESKTKSGKKTKKPTKPQGSSQSNDEQRETNRQREYLERTVEGLKHKLTKDMKIHKAERLRLMRESVELTNEINCLRREYRALKISQKRGKAGKNNKLISNITDDEEIRKNIEGNGESSYGEGSQREIQLQQQQIQSLTEQVNRLEHALGLR